VRLPDEWLPKSVSSLRNYSREKLLHDLIAGVTVGLVALPLAMAFAISSGVAPQAGLYTAIVAGFFGSLLGGSRTQISGPTGAFVVVVFGIVAKYGYDGLALCTLMAGIILVLLGVTGLGTAVKFIPRPVVVGFTNGIALLIASTQIKDFFGLRVEKVPGDFVGRLAVLTDHASTWQLSTTVLSLVALATLILFARYLKRVPGAIVVLLAGTVVAALLKLPVETIATRFGGIPTGLPPIRVPHADLTHVSALIAPAMTVAMLGAIESLMSAVVADRMSGDKHNPNVELIGQGVANMLSPLVGGIPATGAIARTATNIRSGAKTPVSGIVHALTLLAVLLFAAPLANYIPLSILAALLMMVAYNMGEWREIPQILKLTKADIGVWAITFALTVFADLTVAVEAGMILAALLYITRVTRTTTVSRVTAEYLSDGRDHMLHFQEIPNGVAIFRIHGPFLFGSTDKVQDILDQIDELPPVVILRLRNMTALDGTGVQALEEVAQRLKKSGRTALFCGIRQQPAALLTKSGFAKHVGEENLCTNVTSALKRAEEVISGQKLLEVHH
jgi:sulfate permease, SulP family